MRFPGSHLSEALESLATARGHKAGGGRARRTPRCPRAPTPPLEVVVAESLARGRRLGCTSETPRSWAPPRGCFSSAGDFCAGPWLPKVQTSQASPWPGFRGVLRVHLCHTPPCSSPRDKTRTACGPTVGSAISELEEQQTRYLGRGVRFRAEAEVQWSVGDVKAHQKCSQRWLLTDKRGVSHHIGGQVPNVKQGCVCFYFPPFNGERW